MSFPGNIFVENNSKEMKFFNLFNYSAVNCQFWNQIFTQVCQVGIQTYVCIYECPLSHIGKADRLKNIRPILPEFCPCPRYEWDKSQS